MKLIFALFSSLFLFVICNLYFVTSVQAVVDPLTSANNKFGIHIISATPDEIKPAQELINSTGGDWGYVTLLIESKDRDQQKWQKVFDDFRKLHIIPLVRIATQPDGNYWKKPYEGEEIAWADFLDNLNWPTKNRYIIIYNEPNHATEWDGKVDPEDYAQTLDKTITALKNKNPNFFVINGGFDASAPDQYPNYADQLSFMKDMEKAVPGIFEKLDGYSSHSYPNPGFVGKPSDTGRKSIRTFRWEMETLKNLGVKKNLPIFITETGWKHSDGISKISSLPSPEKVAQYFEEAFKNAWSDQRIVAVTPFLLSYQDYPFDHFSFKKNSKNKKSPLGINLDPTLTQASEPEYHPQYYAMQNLPKTSGQPLQESKALLTQGEIYSTVVASESYVIPLTFKNTGQSIWNDGGTVKLVSLVGRQELGIETVEIPTNVKVEPGQEYTFHLILKAPQGGKYPVKLNLYIGDKGFDNPPFEFQTEVKSPVILQINAKLKWKENFSGNYILGVLGAVGNSFTKVSLNSTGNSKEIEARYLLPDYAFDFTLEKPFYQPKTIRKTLKSGINILDFGELQPDIPSAILNPSVLWDLLPFSN